LNVLAAQFAGLVSSQMPTYTAQTASTALDIAAGYKAKASDTRLGPGLPLNANLAAASKAKMIVAEKAAAKQAFESNYIRIDALLYKVTKLRDQERFVEVSVKLVRQ
jgi:hypothetical protein